MIPMLINFVADVHGAYDRLHSLLDPSIPLIVLGDNLNMMDFRTFEGIATEMLDADDFRCILEALGRGDRKNAMSIARSRIFDDPQRLLLAQSIVEREYRKLKAVLPPQSIVMYGNVDFPEQLEQVLGPEMFVDFGVREIGALRFGFVSGTPPYEQSMGLPGEIPLDEYEKRLAELGPVDILCTHMPPDVDDLCFDTVVNRNWGGCRAINKYMNEYQPLYHLFGHIHNPRVSEIKKGRTIIRNAGGFRYNGKLFSPDLPI